MENCIKLYLICIQFLTFGLIVDLMIFIVTPRLREGEVSARAIFIALESK